MLEQVVRVQLRGFGNVSHPENLRRQLVSTDAGIAAGGRMLEPSALARSSGAKPVPEYGGGNRFAKAALALLCTWSRGLARPRWQTASCWNLAML